jgi:NodT family efflux transporter outer membrane factor (OMF) lipoprotein
MTTRLAAAFLGCLVLAGCAGMRPAAPDPQPTPPVPERWQAPLPHGGTLAELSRWWAQFDDPLLERLVGAAQAASPTLASAASRIEQARAARTAAGAALLPALDANASAARGVQDVTLPHGTSASIGLQAGWELDLFGRRGAARDAAEARLQGADAAWHDARVAVAAETASQYVELRGCEALLAQARLEANSRAETARLTDLSMRSGFESRANASLAVASAAQTQAAVAQQAARCEQIVKALVALTALDEPTLRTQLGAASARVPQPAAIAVPNVPADALAQRPDLVASAREVVAASADVAESQAARWPRIALAGSVGAQRFETGGASLDGTTWSIGPVTVSLPIFDGGTRRANVAAARARYDAAVMSYAAALRGAVRDVESALIALQASAERRADAQRAADNFDAYTRAAEAKYRSGLGSLFELEDARRSAFAAQNALIDLRREQVAAWIALYRALGGGWTAPADAASARTRGTAPPDGALATAAPTGTTP